MRRVAVALVVSALVMMATPAFAQSVSLTTPSGPAGTTTGITILDFTASSAFEIHLGGYGGTLLKTGTTNTAGDAINTITIPVGTAPGPVTIAVCETGHGIACTDTSNEFWIGASATFTVTGTTETTATTAATDTTGTTAGTTGSSVPHRAVPAETCVASGSWGGTAAPLATPGDAYVMSFDDYPSESYYSPHAVDADGRVDVTTPPVLDDGGFLFLFGAFEYFTTNPFELGGYHEGPYAGLPTRITEPPVGTVSAPKAVRSDGIFGQTFTILGGPDIEFAYVGLHLGGYEALPGLDVEVTFTVSARHVPAQLEDGTIVTADLGGGEITLDIGPEAIPVNRCIVVGLDLTAWRAAVGDAVLPMGGAVVDIRTEITRGGAGLGGPADMPMYIDDVFFGALEDEAAATTTTLAGPTTSSASSPTTVAAASAGDDSSPSSMTLLLVGGAVLLGLLGAWVLFRPRPRGPKGRG